MKNFGFNVNINSNTNVLISHSESDWSALRDGDLISIGNDKQFYSVNNKEKIFFIQSFKLINNSQISINGNYEYLFLNDDSIKISYKEYELLTIRDIINNGKGYKVGDILSLTGGNLSANIADNTSQSTLFKVEQVDLNGGIQKIETVNRGAYLSFPNKTNKISGGNGTDAEINVEDKLIENRKNIERQITNVKEINSETILTLNYPINNLISDGKISVDKWKAYLSPNYISENKRNIDYHVFRDYTPNLNLPLLVKNSERTEEAFNHSMKIIDQRIAELQEQIKKLRL